jgi:4-amino-4-deoxy-L-arabinose transferase-like glycosyltransferase
MTVRTRMTLAVAALILLAAPFRLVNLGELSFYADEETSAMPAQSLAEGNGPRMPSGMEYRRALPLTWLNAAAARVLGTDTELAYRLPTALLGIATIPLLFLVGLKRNATRAALVAALLLALSEWHLVFSRQARMYVPFLLFFIAAAWAIWNWSETGRNRWLLLAIPMTAGAVTLHRLGLMVVMFALLPLILPGRSRVSTGGLIFLAVTIAILGWAYHEFFVEAPYRAWAPPDPEVTGVIADTGDATAAGVGGTTGLLALLAVLGGACGLYAAYTVRESVLAAASFWSRAALIAAVTAMGALAWTGQLYGACMAAAVLFIMVPGDKPVLVKRARLPLILMAVPAATWVVFAFLVYGLRDGLKAVSTFPYPYPLYLAYQFPVILVLFGSVCLAAMWRTATAEDRPLRAALLAGLLPILAVGAVSRWGGTRYLFAAYPFLLLVAGVGMVWAIDHVGRWIPRWNPAATLALCTIVVFSGALGGHGLVQALRVVGLEHGEPVNEAVHMYPFRPDHASVGRYVRDHRSEHDVVIAEDPLEQWWYAGGDIDYWLRSFGDSRAFLYVAADGELRDIYVGSRLLMEPPPPDSLITAPDGRVWLITSGETYGGRSYYLSARQAHWVDSLESALVPAFTGRDGISRVYCLNCGSR